MASDGPAVSGLQSRWVLEQGPLSGLTTTSFPRIGVCGLSVFIILNPSWRQDFY